MPAEKTAEQLRDERTVPVARGVLTDMTTDLMPEDANVKVDYVPMTMKVMQRVLDADLNVTTENPYVFQLILGAFAGLNKTLQMCETTPIDDARYGAIGGKILAILSTANIRMGSNALTPEEVDADFAPVKEQLNALFKAENLNMLEIQHIRDNLFDAFSSVQNGFMNSVAQSTSDATARVFGLEFVDDLTMGKLESVLKNEPKVLVAGPEDASPAE